jgi:hypothetical protein
MSFELSHFRAKQVVQKVHFQYINFNKYLKYNNKKTMEGGGGGASSSFDDFNIDK